MKQENKFDIILVEDNIYDIELTLRALKKSNISNNVKVIQDGEDAINYFFPKDPSASKISNPQLILLDLRLPKVDGLEILKALKSNQNTKVIPVVVLTSSKEDADIIESYKLGVNSYVTKPLSFDKFVKAVSELGLYWVLQNQAPK